MINNWEQVTKELSKRINKEEFDTWIKPLKGDLKNNKLDKENNYFEIRSKRAKIIRRRSNFNFFTFHFSSKIMQNIRNLFLKFLVKRKFFVKRYLGKVYKN